ncbi:uncharacterized protein si:ch211-63p21.1 [Cyclopterus lumpus]|uniref:uncharacterized protein si:ch211-63p21.1 n=1 Tax=Cyclopterus lumpus TaxID=8103 RepID=UPI0014870C4A|nr:uncharacterized protein si:ch211-63p21.1 [Cyclopterus lumpus]XP_034412837.1 uncharacterized protein si:ch211-63p21.1 [Cyclopterus lumpus]
MLRRESDPRGLFSSGETSDNDCEVGASCGEAGGAVCVCVCVREAGPRAPRAPEAHTPTPDTLPCEHCGKSRVMVTRYSEGYGTEDESEPQEGESDVDADIEDTDCRLQEAGPLQRISSRRRKRARVARQDTTESEDDGGRSHRSPRWNLRLSPERAHSRTIPEESVSQVRPLVVGRPDAARPPERPPPPPPPSSLSLPLLLLLLLLPLSLVIIIIVTLLRP